MNMRLFAIGLLAALAGVIGAVAFIPGAVDKLLPKQATVTTGRALVGGPFALTSHTGTPVTDKDFRGRLMLVYFGYTYCPDICPAGLQVITAALDKLGPDARRVAPLFITVDPARDTAEQLGRYLSSFHKSIVGLTGSVGDIDKAAKAYRVYYRRAQDPSLNDYSMDHSTFIYLMDANGDYITHFPHSIMPDKLAERLAAELASMPK